MIKNKCVLHQFAGNLYETKKKPSIIRLDLQSSAISH